jgi:hypothetical protein
MYPAVIALTIGARRQYIGGSTGRIDVADGEQARVPPCSTGRRSCCRRRPRRLIRRRRLPRSAGQGGHSLGFWSAQEHRCIPLATVSRKLSSAVASTSDVY